MLALPYNGFLQEIYVNFIQVNMSIILNASVDFCSSQVRDTGLIISPVHNPTWLIITLFMPSCKEMQ